MPRYNSDVEYIKHNVLTEVARMHYEDLGEDFAQDIPFKIIPDMKPRYRCCVFKEREILRQRVRLARGAAPYGSKALHYVNVIHEACHGCPINRFQVTANCQKCLAKSCIKECRFGAISMSATGAYIDQSKCRECGKCVPACPYNAITDAQRPCVKCCPVDAITYDKDKIAVIDTNKCVSCGKCIKDCPFGAISESSQIGAVIDAIKNKEYVAAIFAPSIEGQFGTVNLGGITDAIKKLGFSEVMEAGIGADAVASVEAEEILLHMDAGKKTLTSCCPSFFNLIEKHFPALTHYISTAVSPMIAAARLIRSKTNVAKIVFIGPCIAKKAEADRQIDGNVDYVITFEELAAMFAARGITLENSETNSGASLYGRGFALSGGVAAAVSRTFEEKGTTKKAVACTANGASECVKALNILRAGKLEADMLEGMMCEGGCIGGCAALVSIQECRKNRAAIGNKANESILESIEKNNIKDINIER